MVQPTSMVEGSQYLPWVFHDQIGLLSCAKPVDRTPQKGLAKLLE